MEEKEDKMIDRIRQLMKKLDDLELKRQHLKEAIGVRTDKLLRFCDTRTKFIDVSFNHGCQNEWLYCGTFEYEEDVRFAIGEKVRQAIIADYKELIEKLQAQVNSTTKDIEETKLEIVNLTKLRASF